MEADIPFLVPRIMQNHLRLMNSVIGFLALSTVPMIQVNTLCDEWDLSKEKLYQLLQAMERSHLIRVIRKKHDTKVNSVGAKIFLYEPSVYLHFTDNPGTLREALFAGLALEKGYRVFASGKEEECDFIVEDKKIEVGGPGKKIKKADYVIRDNLDLPRENIIPLWMTGMMY